MFNTTIDAVRAILRCDPSVSAAERVRIIFRLRRGDEVKKPEPPKPARLLKREAVADRLACSTRLVDKLATQGVLRKVTLPGRKRAAGFREADIDALVNGLVSPGCITHSGRPP